ncbi:17398_t:CDS:2 [Cetraspora pellucida]|uniref:17398_t:CDS:1 n=1 Tax=Cetraspora pellucida TaxID=1433469 RepID=A0A9N9EFF3_9GLOM|nr:17398_t:CDS:2 [Cetraspora pellucida]
MQNYIFKYCVKNEYAYGSVLVRRLLRESGKFWKGKRQQLFANTDHTLRLLNQITVCVLLCESILLVGETETGKMTTIQYLAELMHQNLIIVNLL